MSQRELENKCQTLPYRPMSQQVTTVPPPGHFRPFRPQYVVGSTPGYALTASGIPYGINVPEGTDFSCPVPQQVAPGLVLINGAYYQKLPQVAPPVPARPYETHERETNQSSSYGGDHSGCMADNLLDLCCDELELMFGNLHAGPKEAESNNSEQKEMTETRNEAVKQVRFAEHVEGNRNSYPGANIANYRNIRGHHQTKFPSSSKHKTPSTFFYD